MASRLDIKDMREIAQLKGGKCLSKEYIDWLTPLKWMCRKGHTWDRGYNIIKQGSWCPQCLKDDFKTEQLERIRQIARQKGGKCLSKEYINNRTKLKFRCAKGHEWMTTPQCIFGSDSWCKRCSGKEKHTIGEMRQLAKSRGGKCLSAKYTDVFTKLSWQCSKGHVWKAEPHGLLRGSWCPRCKIIRLADLLRNDIRKYQKIAIQRGGKLLSKKYISVHTHLLWQCSKKHRWKAEPNAVALGSWCPVCSGNRKHNIEKMRNLAKIKGGYCLSLKYINSQTKLKWQCAKEHRWKTIPGLIVKGSWCPVCANEKKSQLAKTFYKS